MFNFLKDKLKSWVSKNKEESVKTIKIKTKEKTKKDISKEKLKKIKVPKSHAELEKERKIGDNLIEDIKKEKASKIQEEIDQEQEKEKKQGFFGRLFKKEEIDKSTEEKSEEGKHSLFDKFKKKLTEERFEELFQELEISLLQNNVALEVVEEIKRFLKNELIGKNLSEINLEEKLKKAIENILPEKFDLIKEIKRSLAVKSPFVIIFVGINGSGKTTTIAKIANLLKKQKFSVVLAAADTFRAAAIQQLEEHASKLDLPIIKKDYGADPAAVGFDAIAYAKKHHIEIVLIDTAGRMNTKDSLMKEMEKISRVCKPDMRIFIGESITGNDATEQAKAFNSSIDLSGIVLSKADIDEKGGTALSVSHVTKKPILFLGTGQKYEDLTIFDKKDIIKNLGL